MWSYNYTFQYSYYPSLRHHGVKGQKWGVKNGPPYPLKRGLKKKSKSSKIIEEAINSGKVLTKINRQKQERHMWNHNNYINGRSYLYGDVNDAQRLVDELSCTGEPICVKGIWQKKERVTASYNAGVHVSFDGKKEETNHLIITYSNTGTHVMPGTPPNKEE